MKTSNVGNKYGNWVFIVPISNLFLSDKLNKEYQIGRVSFISSDKLPRIRKRLGFYKKLSEIKKRFYIDFFGCTKTYAVYRITGKPNEIRNNCLNAIREALYILCTSQLGFSQRLSHSRFGIYGEHISQKSYVLFSSSHSDDSLMNFTSIDSPIPLELNGLWKNYQDKIFFSRLMNIINGKIYVNKYWRSQLKRAAILIGKGMQSYDVPSSFLNNMIALEILLTKQGDKYSQVLPERIEAFLGWAGYWETHNFEPKINRIYDLRCEFVHNGIFDNITESDLLFTDELLLNLLTNLCSHPITFQTKDDVISFSDKVKAEKLLGGKRKIRPKKLVFLRQRTIKTKTKTKII